MTTALLWASIAALAGGLAERTASAQDRARLSLRGVPYAIVEADFYPFGGYQILGAKPRGFEGLDNFTLRLTEDPVRSRDLRVAGTLTVSAESRPDQPSITVFRMAELGLTTDSLAFSTDARSGIHYQFRGRFLRRGDLARFWRGRVPVLEGILTKSTQGARVAESRLRFRFVVWRVREPAPARPSER